jgi:hypothetical protein
MPTVSSNPFSIEQESLVRAATLAASSHNSQPWLFELSNDLVRVLPDLRRRCPVVDPDEHHLYVSLGCATENLAVAAHASGRLTEVSVGATESGTSVIEVRLTGGLEQDAGLANAIARRQCSRAKYEERSVSSDTLTLLERAATRMGVNAIVITDAARKAAVADWVAQGNTVQINDPDWRRELVGWLRFNEREARDAGDGLWSRTTGNPDVPRLLGKAGLPFFLNPRAQNRKDVPWTRGSAGIIVFVADQDDARHWIEVGRCYQRFALQATALGLCSTFINQPIEVPGLRRQFATWLGLGAHRPDLVVRFGYGPEMPRSLRRPLTDVIVARGTHTS